MNTIPSQKRLTNSPRAAGFSMLEMMTGLAVLLIVSGGILSSMLTMMRTQAQVSNRTEMHATVRSATELIEQEITQAGRVVLPGNVSLAAAVATGDTTATVNSATGMFVGEQLVVDSFNPNGGTPCSTSNNVQETVTISAIATNTLTVSAFTCPHAKYSAVAALGAFATGVIPPSASPVSYTNGSDDTHLKLYGDINGDGNMVYIEYTCDTTAGKLYRNVMPFKNATKPANDDTMVLLNNIQANPNNAACFTYQPLLVGTTYYVVDVSVTLTVQTQNPDAWTRSHTSQSTLETKALLNVAPRNVFEAWQLAALGYSGLNNRVQPIPASVGCLIKTTATGCNLP